MKQNLDTAARARLITHFDHQLMLLEQERERTQGQEQLRPLNQRIRNLRMKIARLRGSHTRSEWEAIVAETGGICVRCGYQHLLPLEQPRKGYITPIVLGGSDAITNLMPVCGHCAVSKKAERIDWLAEWRKNRDATPLTGPGNDAENAVAPVTD